MDVQALKMVLIQKVLNTEDESVLKQLKALLELEGNQVSELSESLKRSVQTGLEDVEKGKVVSHEKVREIFNLS